MANLRRGTVRRRVYRVKVKWAYDVTARRWKRLAKLFKLAPGEEWTWEWIVMELLEIDTYAALQAMAVPTSLWPFYMGFAKKVWNRYLLFFGATLDLEIQSLENEYVLRGLDLATLQALEPYAQEYSLMKLYWPRTHFEPSGAVASGWAGIMDLHGPVTSGDAGILSVPGMAGFWLPLGGENSLPGGLADGEGSGGLSGSIGAIGPWERKGGTSSKQGATAGPPGGKTNNQDATPKGTGGKAQLVGAVGR
jgi:hypothetical protein